jgi:signal transduction histidine kinase
MKEKLIDLLAWCKRQTYHFIFISSLLALTMLVTWWAIFLYQSVNQTYETKLEGAHHGVYSYSLFLSHNAVIKPQAGPYSRDNRLEIVHAHAQPGPIATELLPYWKNWWLKPKEQYLNQLIDKRNRQRLMVIGESSFLLLLILMSGLMIYRMYWLEKRTTQELHELWSRVSHEIKTPITGVKAFLETLQSQPLSRQEMAPLLELALKQVDRQQQLSENMLVGQKLKRRASGIKLKQLPIRAYLQSYIEKHPFHLSGGKLSLSCPGDEVSSPIVSADPEALRIIFDNLIENARKYGGDQVSIDICLEQRGKWANISVQDNGPGFEPGMAGNIFKAYKRLGNELPGKEQKGTGMGMYICRRLAKKMKGTLTAQSQGIGKGARFILALKLTRHVPREG